MNPAQRLAGKLHWRRTYGGSWRDTDGSHEETPLPFDIAWGEAVEYACCRLPEGEEWWLEWFEATEDTWRRAYERAEQTPGEEALTLLLASRRGGEPITEPERRCAQCRGPIVGRAAQARYCSPECEREAARERWRTRRAAHCTPSDSQTLAGAARVLAEAVGA
jgi:hypothetical protein